MNKKVFLKIILLIIVILFTFNIKSYGASDFSYTLDANDNATITAYNGTESNLTIPSTIDGYDVIAIGAHAFHESRNSTNGHTIKNVIISEGITKIDGWAFCECTNLESVKLPESLTTIGLQTFLKCGKLTQINIPKNLEFLHDGCLEQTGLEEIVIPENIKKFIGSEFRLCKSLKKVIVYNDSIEYYNNGYDTNVFERCADDLILYGNEGSTTQQYAQEKNLTFKLISELDNETQPVEEKISIEKIVSNIKKYLKGEKTAGYAIVTESGSSSSNLDISDGVIFDVTYDDEYVKIKLINEEDSTEAYESKVKYTIENDKVTFSSTKEIGEDDYGSALMEIMITPDLLFLSITDEYEIDSNIALAYFDLTRIEVMDENGNMEVKNNDVFYYKTDINEKNIKTIFEIYLNQIKSEKFVVENFMTPEEYEEYKKKKLEEIEESAKIAEKQSFNAQFTPYEGDRSSAAQVRSLIAAVTASNAANEEHQIELIKPENIKSSSTYSVTMLYDSEGYINKIEIKDNAAVNNEQKQEEQKQENQSIGKDNTISTNVIPNTGKTIIGLILTITILATSVWITRLKLKDMKF